MTTTAAPPEDNPFTTSSVNCNPQCTPVKPGTINAVRLLKPPKPPERPLMPYMRYSRANLIRPPVTLADEPNFQMDGVFSNRGESVWDAVKAEHKDCKLWEIGRIIGQLWRELPGPDKQKYIDEWEKEKNEYAESLKVYQNSTAYQQYLVAKEKANATGSTTIPEPTPAKSSSQTSSNRREKWAEGVSRRQAANVTVSTTSAAQQSHNEQARYPASVPPVDSECAPMSSEMLDGSDIYNMRRLSATRYARNQRLLYEILNEAAVPDLRSIVTLPRMHMLKRQVHSLTMHQEKLESDLKQLDNKFDEKKRQIEDTRDEFQAKMRKLCQPAVDADAYEKMIEKAKEQLLKDYDRFKNGPPAEPEPTVTTTATTTATATATTADSTTTSTTTSPKAATTSKPAGVAAAAAPKSTVPKPVETAKKSEPEVKVPAKRGRPAKNKSPAKKTKRAKRSTEDDDDDYNGNSDDE